MGSRWWTHGAASDEGSNQQKDGDRVVCTLRLCRFCRQDESKFSSGPAPTSWKSSPKWKQWDRACLGWLCGRVACIAVTQTHSSTGCARPDPIPAAESSAGFSSSAMDHHMDRELKKDPSHSSNFACLKPQQHTETVHNCFNSWQNAQGCMWGWPQGWKKVPTKWWGPLDVVVAYYNFCSHRLMCPTAKKARSSARQLRELIAMNKKRGSAKCMR